MSISRFVRTVWPMRADQILNRVSRRLRNVDFLEGEEYRLVSSAANNFEGIQAPACWLTDREVIHLNVRGQIDDWQSSSHPLLWLYHHHYFDGLRSDQAQYGHHYIDNWLDANPAGSRPGWDPYPTSLRIVNWLKWLLSGNSHPKALASIAEQANVLSQSVEYHLLTNHILANAKALIFAGRLLDGPKARNWLALGDEILCAQLEEQVLGDGGHVERSPMYHAIVLEDLLDLIQLHRLGFSLSDSTVDTLIEKAVQMQTWLLRLSHPDGDIAFFNDSCLGQAPSPGDLYRYGVRLGLRAESTEPVPNVKASGFWLAKNDRITLLADIGDPSPSYNPGHAHAEALCFELSVDDQRVFVNSGISEYGEGELRHLQRATRSHNTVEIDGISSCELWGGFRMGARSQVFDLREASDGRQVSVSASHNGYSTIFKRLIHNRLLEVSESRLVVRDKIHGSFSNAVAFFHLHPYLTPEVSENGVIISSPEGLCATVDFRGGVPTVHEERWFSSFGSYETSYGIAVSITGTELTTTVSL